MPKPIIQILKENKTFLLTTHVNVDPDALCSQLAMGLFLKWLGRKPILIGEEKIPARYQFLDASREIKVLSKRQKIDYDALIVLDCGDLNRIGEVKRLLDEDKPIINIDHHVTNELFADFNLVKPKASSTCEVLYEFFKDAGFPLTKRAAVLLYTGIMTDTGSFCYDNTTAKTHRIVSDLLKFNLPVHELYRRLYEMMLLEDIKKFSRLIGDIAVLFKGKIVCVKLSRRAAAKFSQNFDLRDTIFKFLRAIQGVEVVVIFTEIESRETRVNFRSNGKYDVARLAKVFQGGGHRQASGCLIKENIAGAKKAVLTEVKKIIGKDL